MACNYTTAYYCAEDLSNLINVLQYLRALAAILVVITHLAFKSSIVGHSVFGGFRIGAAGVDIFFVISGFVMAMIYWRLHDRSPGVFWTKRLIRIFPIYWLVTSAALLLYLVNPALVNANSGPTSIWRSYTLIPELQARTTQLLIGPAWSLSFEFYFYTLFAGVFAFSQRSVGLAVAVSVLVLLALGSLSGLAPSYLLTSPLLLEFAFGIVVFALYTRTAGRFPTAVSALVIGGALLGFTLLNAPGAFVVEQRWWRAGGPAALLVLGALSLEQWASRAPSRLWLLLGDASYALYLVHVFALGAASRVFGMLGLTRFGPTAEVAYWLVNLLGTIAAGVVVHRYIEMPLAEAVRRALRRRMPDSKLAPARPGHMP